MDQSRTMTFIVNPDGIVFQRDQAPNTAKIAAATRLFEPDWS
jgi:filamentous hemagglutinin family protein